MLVQKTEINKDNVKEFIVTNSSIIGFCDYWSSYYDWHCAGEQTVTDYRKDIEKHKIKVRELLSSVSNEKILDMIDTEDTDNCSMANKVLKDLEYEFTR